jgi:hypothetical protein
MKNILIVCVFNFLPLYVNSCSIGSDGTDVSQVTEQQAMRGRIPRSYPIDFARYRDEPGELNAEVQQGALVTAVLAQKTGHILTDDMLKLCRVSSRRTHSKK